MKLKVGVAFGGGGSKGAWQIGVWSTLAQHCDKFEFTAVSGTSVGALNATLFAAYGKLGEEGWKKAYAVWQAINGDDLASVDTILKRISEKTEKILNIRGRLDRFGVFSVEGLERIIKNNVPLDDSSAQNYLPTWITVHNVSENKCEYLKIFPDRNYTSEERCRLLLASSAIPFVFPDQEIRNKKYNDGGIDLLSVLTDDILSWSKVDNCPVFPLQDAGKCDIIIAMPTNMDEIIKFQNAGIPVIPVMPGRDLGWGLDFEKRLRDERINLGKIDAENALAPVMKIFEQSQKKEKILDQLRQNFHTVCKKNCAEETNNIKQVSCLQQLIYKIEHCEDKNILQELILNVPAPDIVEIMSFNNKQLLERQELKHQSPQIENLLSEIHQTDVEWDELFFSATGNVNSAEANIHSLQEQAGVNRFYHEITGKNNKSRDAILQSSAVQARYSNMLHLKTQEKFTQYFEVCSGIVRMCDKMLTRQELERRELDFQNRCIMSFIIQQACNQRIAALENSDRLQNHERRIQKFEWYGKTKNLLADHSPAFQFCASVLSFYYHFYDDIGDRTFLENWLHEIKIDNNNIKLEKKEKEFLQEYCNTHFFIPNYNLLIAEEKAFKELPENSQTAISAPMLKNAAVECFNTWKDLKVTPKALNYSSVGESFLGKINQLKQILQTLSGYVVNLHQIEQGLISLEQECNNFTFRIVFAGKFSSGKSTLINRILGDKYLPRDTDPTTAASLEVYYNEETNQLTLPGKDCPYPISSSKKVLQLIEDAAKTDGRKEISQKLELWNPRLLRYGKVSFVDMPGIGANEKHDDIFKNYINRYKDSIGIVYCINAEDASHEIAIYRDYEQFIQNHQKIIIVTHADDEDTKRKCQTTLETYKMSADAFCSTRDNKDFFEVLKKLASGADDCFCRKFNAILKTRCDDILGRIQFCIDSCTPGTEILDNAIKRNRETERKSLKFLSEQKQKYTESSKNDSDEIIKKLSKKIDDSLNLGNDCRTIGLNVKNHFQFLASELTKKRRDEILQEIFSITGNNPYMPTSCVQWRDKLRWNQDYGDEKNGPWWEWIPIFGSLFQEGRIKKERRVFADDLKCELNKSKVELENALKQQIEILITNAGKAINNHIDAMREDVKVLENSKNTDKSKLAELESLYKQIDEMRKGID